ncbi:AMP-binding protein [Vibrio sp. 99-8-1]|uniref:AMP-binding protein n=1 Tax=Vibrio sp. 99-8-1 TaxID=2607602 RepID=UPI0014935502|nr:AMP-binding protein [Vibrio sp. 99-8-1]NOI66953.1 AMP-binding protein [Vibrio sp. 99-8-1]
MSIVEKVLAHAESIPKKIAIHDKNSGITYEELAKDIKRVAFNLQQQVDFGDAVLVKASNSYSFIVVYFAIHYAGAKVVNIATDVDENYKRFVTNKVRPSLCIDDCHNFIQKLDSDSQLDTCQASYLGYADLMFTSGTTGEPKGVALTHNQLTEATEHIISQVGNTADDVELLLMPLSHSFGMARMRTTLYAGGALVVGYPLQRLKGVFKAFKNHHITGLGLVPSAWSFITQMSKDLIKKYASQLNYIEFGSAYLSPEDKALLTEWFPNTHLVMHYGLTEVSRAVFTHFHADDHEAVGHVSRGAEFVIFKENGIQAEQGTVGEIAFKAPWMFTSYYENSDLTLTSFIDGYFRTGDLGKVEGDYLYLTGRLKEIINVGGKKVSPYQVERIINQSDLVLECACIPYADSNMGEVVQVFIVLESNVEDDFKHVVEQLKIEVAKHLPVHMRPHRYQQINALPKTASGKLQRLQLASM